MNQKIKQFAELSKSYKTILVDGQMQSVLLIDPERFAQMIIQECVDFADHSNVTGKSIIGQRIKEHFGIKE
jgi:hypothetical protein